MTHPGDNWPRKCHRVYDKPVLPIEGRRNIFTTWPPGAACEKCYEGLESGYVGPVLGDWVVYPAPETRFICEPCARSLLGLNQKELYGHSCQDPRCGDIRHVVMTFPIRGTWEGMTDFERVDECSSEFAEYGWKVVAVEPSPLGAGPDTIGTTRWDIWIEPMRDLPWPLPT